MIHPRNSALLEDPASISLGPSCLRLDMYILERCCSIAGEASKQKALSFLKWECCTTLISSLGKSLEKTNEYTTALATALELGLDWMAQTCQGAAFNPLDEAGVEKVVWEIKHRGFGVIEMSDSDSRLIVHASRVPTLLRRLLQRLQKIDGAQVR
jgi:acetolactate synthase regulatory subunit